MFKRFSEKQLGRTRNQPKEDERIAEARRSLAARKMANEQAREMRGHLEDRLKEAERRGDQIEMGQCRTKLASTDSWKQIETETQAIHAALREKLNRPNEKK